MIPIDSSNDPAVNRMSIRVVDTADSARSTRDSILSLYGHRSYYHKILDPREGPFAMALEMQVDYSRVSRIIDDHLEDNLLPVEATSNAVDKGLDVHASASIEYFNNPQQAPPWSGLPWHYPCRAIAVASYKDPFSRLSYEKNERLLVAAFSGTTWRVRKTTGEEGLVPSHSLIPYYPYRARLRSNSFVGPPVVLENEIVNVSQRVEFDPPIHGFYYWRPWRKKTGETDISPDYYFDNFSPPGNHLECFPPDEPSNASKPLPPLPGDGELVMLTSISYILRARVGDDCSGKPIDALSLTKMEIVPVGDSVCRLGNTYEWWYT